MNVKVIRNSRFFYNIVKEQHIERHHDVVNV